MKYYKIYFALIVGCLLSLTSCEDDENLNLQTYPDNETSVIISDSEGESELTLNATYNEDGILVVDGQVTRTYTFTFKPSPEDIIVSYDLLSKNIPAEIVSISKLVDTIPAGYSESSVEVILKDDDFSFAQTNYNEEIYELGVKATATGYKIPTDTTVAKLSIKKEAYSTLYSLVGEKGSTTTFERAYNNGQILNEDSISYSFKVVVDKPVLNELKLKLSMEGLNDKFLNTVTWSSTEVTIPAGEKSSEVITWSIKDDFLMETAEEETHSIKLAATSEDTSTPADPEKGFVTLNIIKSLRNIAYLSGISSDWSLLNKTGWGIEANSSVTGNISRLIDGQGGVYGTYAYNSSYLFFTIDITSEQALKGLSIDYYGGTVYSAKSVKISTSTDKVNWTSQGELNTPASLNNYFKFLSDVNARYVKIEMTGSYGTLIVPSEIYIYK